jgi:hypothetical protein
MTNTTRQSGARSWIITGITVGVIALIVAVVISCGSGVTRTRTVTVTTVASPSDPPTATLNFTPTQLADGAHGTVTATPSGKSDIRLTINVTVPKYQTYGIALWSDVHHWTGLYTAAQGTNIQIMAVRLETLVGYKQLEVGFRVIRARISRRRGIRVDRRSVQYHDLMYVSTGELLNKLLATRRR